MKTFFGVVLASGANRLPLAKAQMRGIGPR